MTPTLRLLLASLLLVGCDAGAGTAADAGSPSDSGTRPPVDAALCAVDDPFAAATPACGAAACGNGVVDECSCNRMWWGSGLDAGGTYRVSKLEECDPMAGALASTCESLGYSGGTLRCGTDCTVDKGGCDACASDPAIAACTSAAGGGPIDAAASASEVAVAWTADDTIHLTRFGAELALLGDASARAGGVLSPYVPPRLAATESGWLAMAASDAGELVTARFDALGAPVGAARVLEPSASTASLAGGGALGTWVTLVHFDPVTTEREARVALLSADGTPLWTRALLTSLWPLSETAVVATTAGAIVAVVTDAADAGTVRLFSIDPAGAVTEMPALAGPAMHVSVSWEGSYGLLRFQDGWLGSEGNVRVSVLDARGAITAGPEVTAGSNGLGEVAGPFLAELSATRDSSDIAVTRRTSTGRSAAPMVYPRASPAAVWSLAAVARGANVVVAWSEGDATIRIAELTL